MNQGNDSGLQPIARIFAAAVSFLAFFALLSCSNTTQAKKGPGGKGRGGEGAVPVVVATVMLKDVPVNIDVIGNVEAYSTISLKAQVGGQLIKSYFQEGDYVKSGDPLFTIDPRPYQGQLNQAEAQLGQAQANLSRDIAAQGQAEANLARDSANEKYARDQAGRYQKLFEEGVVSREQTDQMRSSADALAQTIQADKAAIESARAQIVASRAAVESAKATIENMRVQLGYTSILSPIDGRTGSVTVKVGNVVSPNSMELMTIAQVHPIYVTFSVPEAQLGDIKRFMSQGKLTVVARQQDNATETENGVLTFIDNSVDSSTGTIKLKGTFQNPDNKLWPGEFVRVSLQLTRHPNAIVVPNQAVQTGQEGQFVYVVKQDRTVEMRPVVPGTRVDQELVIDSGLAAGETVVTEGQLRLAPGTRVQFGPRQTDAGRSPQQTDAS